jgi:hypothetical protein
VAPSSVAAAAIRTAATSSTPPGCPALYASKAAFRIPPQSSGPSLRCPVFGWSSLVRFCRLANLACVLHHRLAQSARLFLFRATHSSARPLFLAFFSPSRPYEALAALLRTTRAALLHSSTPPSCTAPWLKHTTQAHRVRPRWKAVVLRDLHDSRCAYFSLYFYMLLTEFSFLRIQRPRT